MRAHLQNIVVLASSVIALLICVGHVESGELDFFESKIRPVLVKHCYECHSVDSKQIGGEFLLDSREGMRKGGESGEAIVPGDTEASLLLSAIRYEDFEMPPSGKLPEKVIADFEKWVSTGAHDPRVEEKRATVTRPQIDIEAGREFWSFQPPKLSSLPTIENTEWPERKIDYFVLAKVENAGLSNAPRADRRTLVRRVTFDLTGLPPTPEEVERFIEDERPDAYPRLVERLLGSPRFGERWSRLWLDVARYAEDQAHIVGNNDSLFYPNAYLYRNWLIDAFNDDIAYDRFAKLQLAADLIEPDANHHLAALGFLGLGPKYYRRNAPEVMADEWEDRVDTVTRGLLGLTVACARCHDHKYDPIPTEDYYGLAGVFASTKMFNRPLDANADQTKDTKKAKDAMHVVRESKPIDIPVHIRGDAFNTGEKVPRRFLQVLSPSPRYLQDGSGRAQLADAIASESNPLTARVFVNRIWHQYLGRPLVETPSNFGSLGGRPSHPKLLDDLAVRFMQSGWSMKWLHRELVLSATYQQSSTPSVEAYDKDPTNALLSRMSNRRLSLEMWRDAMLCATGELSGDIGGKSEEVDDLENARRSVYSKVSRLELNGMLQMFDFPNPSVHAASRSETTTPLQKLFALNSDFMVQRAERLISRLDREFSSDTQDKAGDKTAARIARAYELVLSRPASSEEIGLAKSYLRSDKHWVSFAQVLLASNEMLFLD